ncbi:MAG: P-II family nitrogen regulator [Bacteroidetes bacterium]|nr:P-II family nitrogen regulator [Bacteroidota bacterium]
MKLIVAIIRENQLDQVRESLIQAGISRITVNNVSGHGRRMTEEIYRGQKVVPSLTPSIRLEIAVNDQFAKVTVDAIVEATKANDSGMVGSGKIFIMPIEECIRIRTGEKGSKAI